MFYNLGSQDYSYDFTNLSDGYNLSDEVLSFGEFKTAAATLSTVNGMVAVSKFDADGNGVLNGAEVGKFYKILSNIAGEQSDKISGEKMNALNAAGQKFMAEKQATGVTMMDLAWLQIVTANVLLN